MTDTSNMMPFFFILLAIAAKVCICKPSFSLEHNQFLFALAFYQALTSKFSCIYISAGLRTSVRGRGLPLGSMWSPPVRSANFLPANACSAFFAVSGESNLTKIFPTPADCLLPPTGRGILSPRTVPNFSHSSWTSSLISAGKTELAPAFASKFHNEVRRLTFVVIIVHELVWRDHVEQLKHPA